MVSCVADRHKGSFCAWRPGANGSEFSLEGGFPSSLPPAVCLLGLTLVWQKKGRSVSTSIREKIALNKALSLLGLIIRQGLGSQSQPLCSFIVWQVIKADR